MTTQRRTTVPLTFPLPSRRWLRSGGYIFDERTGKRSDLWYSEAWTAETRAAAMLTHTKEKWA